MEAEVMPLTLTEAAEVPIQEVTPLPVQIRQKVVHQIPEIWLAEVLQETEMILTATETEGILAEMHNQDKQQAGLRHQVPEIEMLKLTV